MSSTGAVHGAETNRAARAVRAAALAPIVLYQRVISPALPRRCKYEPTCSRYAAQAIRRYGALRGLVLAGWRLLRCNPFSYGGYDPVEAQRLFGHRRLRSAEERERAGGEQDAGAGAPAPARGGSS